MVVVVAVDIGMIVLTSDQRLVLISCSSLFLPLYLYILQDVLSGDDEGGSPQCITCRL